MKQIDCIKLYITLIINIDITRFQNYGTHVNKSTSEKRKIIEMVLATCQYSKYFRLLNTDHTLPP